MKLIKESYSTIKFPIIDSDNTPDKIFSLYLYEFSSHNLLDYYSFVAITLSGARDFLEGRLSEWGVASLMNALFTNKLSKKYINSAETNNNNLVHFMNELMDISWMKEASQPEKYKEYLSELKVKFDELVREYELYFKAITK